MKRVIVCGKDGQPVANATVVIYSPPFGVYRTDSTGGVNIGDPETDTIIKVQDIPDYQTTIFTTLLLKGDGNICIGTPVGGPNDVYLGVLKPNFPDAPTREQVLGVNLTFQGLTVTTNQYGVLPWFEAALAWLTYDDRQRVYDAKHKVGDTHCIIQFPFGDLYPEPNQPYNQFPPLDWTNNYLNLLNLGIEVIEHGFYPIIFPDERQDESLAQMQQIIKTLKDIVPYCIFMTGWDGVFYGWEPSHVVIPKWAATMRAINPNVYLGIEHNQGHIPLGEGGDDYLPNGNMKDFDVVFGEYDGWLPSNSPGDEVWQILGRMIRPYNRPPDQPQGDDPNPPFYLVDSDRGPRYYCTFEFDEYRWVRNGVSASQISDERNYLKACGSKYTG
jgi:hypothetical protein